MLGSPGNVERLVQAVDVMEEAQELHRGGYSDFLPDLQELPVTW